MLPEWFQTHSKMIQNCPRMISKWSQSHPKIDPQLFQNDPNMHSTLFKQCPRIIPKSFQNHPKMIPKSSQHDSKFMPKWFHNHPNMNSKLPPNHSKMIPNPKSSQNQFKIIQQFPIIGFLRLGLNTVWLFFCFFISCFGAWLGGLFFYLFFHRGFCAHGPFSHCVLRVVLGPGEIDLNSIWIRFCFDVHAFSVWFQFDFNSSLLNLIH